MSQCWQVLCQCWQMSCQCWQVSCHCWQVSSHSFVVLVGILPQCGQICCDIDSCHVTLLTGFMSHCVVASVDRHHVTPKVDRCRITVSDDRCQCWQVSCPITIRLVTPLPPGSRDKNPSAFCCVSSVLDYTLILTRVYLYIQTYWKLFEAFGSV